MATAQSSELHNGMTATQRRWAIVAIYMALALVSLDVSIANIALPAMSRDFGADAADIVWVVNVYQIVLVATLLPLGALGEIVGHQRVYSWGLALFTLATIACALAWSLPSLLVARTIQGLGAAGVMSVNIALVRYVYPPHQLGRGLGHNALVVAAAFTAGPAVASAILTVASWEWLFAFRIPFCALAFLIGLKTLPQTPRGTHSFDRLGAAMATAALGLLIVGLSTAAHRAPWPLVALQLAGGALLCWLVVRRQKSHPAPMLPVDLFRRPMFTLSALTAVCSFSVQGIAFVALPFYFEYVLHRSQIETGLFLTPWALVVGMMAPIAGPLSDKYAPGLLGGLGLGLLCLGMFLLTTMPTSPSTLDIIWRMVICGAGFGLFQAPNMKAIMTSAPAGRSGSASGIVATARLTGQTSGAALAGTCFGLFGNQTGATVALGLGAAFAAAGCLISSSRLFVAQPTD